MFMNIYYVLYNEKCTFVCVWAGRESGGGGKINHAVVQLPDGNIIDPKTGELCNHYDIEYRYDFDLFFNY